tara:strand:+ start:1357 stop:3105 length:1749 start_codon:yes stop_codon:yes gene_type:complete
MAGKAVTNLGLGFVEANLKRTTGKGLTESLTTFLGKVFPDATDNILARKGIKVLEPYTSNTTLLQWNRLYHSDKYGPGVVQNMFRSAINDGEIEPILKFKGLTDMVSRNTPSNPVTRRLDKVKGLDSLLSESEIKGRNPVRTLQSQGAMDHHHMSPIELDYQVFSKPDGAELRAGVEAQFPGATSLDSAGNMAGQFGDASKIHAFNRTSDASIKAQLGNHPYVLSGEIPKEALESNAVKNAKLERLLNDVHKSAPEDTAFLEPGSQRFDLDDGGVSTVDVTPESLTKLKSGTLTDSEAEKLINIGEKRKTPKFGIAGDARNYGLPINEKGKYAEIWPTTPPEDPRVRARWNPAKAGKPVTDEDKYIGWRDAFKINGIDPKKVKFDPGKHYLGSDHSIVHKVINDLKNKFEIAFRRLVKEGDNMPMDEKIKILGEVLYSRQNVSLNVNLMRLNYIKQWIRKNRSPAFARFTLENPAHLRQFVLDQPALSGNINWMEMKNVDLSWQTLTKEPKFKGNEINELKAVFQIQDDVFQRPSFSGIIYNNPSGDQALANVAKDLASQRGGLSGTGPSRPTGSATISDRN